MYGKIYMVNEEEELRKMIVSGINTVAITDDAESFKFTPVLVASILLPPYESVEADSMGNVEQAHNMYVGWLSQPSCMKCLVTIVAALSLGKDIGLVMAKGVLFGVISVVTILPAMLLIFDKAMWAFDKCGQF